MQKYNEFTYTRILIKNKFNPDEFCRKWEQNTLIMTKDDLFGGDDFLVEVKSPLPERIQNFLKAYWEEPIKWLWIIDINQYDHVKDLKYTPIAYYQKWESQKIFLAIRDNKLYMYISDEIRHQEMPTEVTSIGDFIKSAEICTNSYDR